MHRKKFLHASILGFAAVTFGKNSFAKMLSIDPWQITMLTKEIGIFTDKGGTIAFHFSKDGITVIDSQFPDSAQVLIAELKKRNGQPFHLLINTHHHGDHTSGNIAFKDLLTRVVAHENSLANQKKVAVANHTEDKQFYPTQTFSKTWSENAGKEKIAMYYFGAGHTDGDAVIHFEKADIAHVGDLVFNHRHPFVDRTAGANMQSWIKVLEETAKKFGNKTIFICGHSGNGSPVTGDSGMLLSFRDYLANVLKFVGAQIKDGKTKEEILTAKEIPGSPEWEGDGIQRPLTAAYEELTLNS